jgi:hypothetical protein
MNTAEFLLDHQALYTFGFYYLRKMLKYSIELQSILIKGKKQEYFKCTDEKLKKV